MNPWHKQPGVFFYLPQQAEHQSIQLDWVEATNERKS